MCAAKTMNIGVRAAAGWGVTVAGNGLPRCGACGNAAGGVGQVEPLAENHDAPCKAHGMGVTDFLAQLLPY
ncbi:hypothetical protein D3C85_1321020 [compost metagenome]